jgi:hypothetical protein
MNAGADCAFYSRSHYWPVSPVDPLAQQVGVAVVPGVLLYHVDRHSP